MKRSDRTAPRRTPQQWIVDTGLFLAAAVYGVLVSGLRVEDPSVTNAVPVWLFNLDQLVGILACVALWSRRRWPTGLALVLIVLAAYFEMVFGAMLVAVFTVAVHRSPRTSLFVLGGAVLSTLAHLLLRPELRSGYSIGEGVFQTLVLLTAVLGWGLYVQHRRQLYASLRERAEQAENENLRGAAQARRQVRDEMAREIHDVLGHRLSLLSLHAGALSYRPDMPREDLVRATTVIREGTHQALQDLREVIGVLRAPVDELPQPTLSDLPELIEESRETGMTVDFTIDTDERPADRVARAVYRTAQESLTNAHKHAPGARVHVTVSGAPGKGLSVAVKNTAPRPEEADGADAPAGGTSKQGLIGLSERASLLSGRLDYGPTQEGGWHVSAWFPWAS